MTESTNPAVEEQTSGQQRKSVVGSGSPTPPETGDIVVDAALRDLVAASPDDLEAQLATGEAVHRTLQSRLADLGG